MTLGYTQFDFSEWQLEGRTLRLGYRLSGGPRPAQSFEEVLELPPALDAPDARDPAVRRVLDVVHRTFGVSYYKAACPEQVGAEAVPGAVADYWDFLYTEGLGEFYFRNGLDPRGHVRFPRTDRTLPKATTGRAPTERALVLVGGGKDSVVAREVLRHAGVECAAFSLGTATWIERSAEAMGLVHHHVGRRLDPALFALNEQGAYNGHVPISACIAAIGELVALTSGFTAIVAANERSADEGNTQYEGLSINHQFSKSLRFESAFRALMTELVDEPPLYFSVLRPMSELAIAAQFVRHPQYHEAVTSCNRNFRVREPRAERRWCGRCPKCVFVYLMVAPHADDAILTRVFGDDFLAAPENLGLLADLAGVGGMKPFECVGTPLEVRAALWQLHTTKRLPEVARSWHEGAALADANLGAYAWEQAMALDPTYRLPGEWQARLDAYLGSR